MDLIPPAVRRACEEARRDPEAFWSRAAEAVPWFQKWDRAFDWTPPTFRWFSGGKTNLAWNAVDHHVAAGRGGHAALAAINERGQRRVYTFGQLKYEVQRVAAALRGMGVGKGDRITIYMPTIPEAIFTMLAAVRIGAMHVVVFAGFGAGALGDRIAASGSRLVLTSDITFRKGKDVRLKEIVDAALEKSGSGAVEHVIVLKRTADPVPMKPGRDIGWEEFLQK